MNTLNPNQDKQPTRVAILGYGFMGKNHARAFQRANDEHTPCKIVAIADPFITSIIDAPDSGNIATKTRPIDLSNVDLVENAQSIINNPDIDLISICTHTDTHVDLGIEALNAGKHVLVEKPIAINPTDVQRLATAAARAKTHCIPAMCMRYWPAWTHLNTIIDTKPYGAVRSATFQRLGTRPNWSADFYADTSKSGGVLQDLHIHDTDFIVHCFGLPNSVTTVGDQLHLTTLYNYQQAATNPIHVTAAGAWDHQPAVGYQMKYTIVCDRATIDFDINRADQLIIYEDSKSTPIQVGPLTGYDLEIRYILDLIKSNAKPNLAPINSAVQVAHILAAEEQSMKSRSTIQINHAITST